MMLWYVVSWWYMVSDVGGDDAKLSLFNISISIAESLINLMIPSHLNLNNAQLLCKYDITLINDDAP